ncbi:uncharacterized protein LOC128735688 [Sabethes cyaneus]|uniref:uncharacterized protein LOC128735688 n=1 Tax=Sabethes cyaneus TaxID=53552 RepID=UPI00237E12F9|nr:uncharacterized protein LOC128735688 [Sabethes cyaneus]
MNRIFETTRSSNMSQSLSSATNLLYAVSEDEGRTGSDDNIIIDELTEVEPTSIILRYCKRKFLRPYVCILGLVGLRPNAVDVDLGTLLGHLQSIMVLVLLLGGYVLQYLSGFRLPDFAFCSDANNLIQTDEYTLDGCRHDVTYENGIRIAYQNVRGLRIKIDELFLTAFECNLDIIILTETGLDN